MQHWPDFFSSLHSVTLGPLMVSVQRFAQWKYSKLAIPAAIKKKVTLEFVPVSLRYWSPDTPQHPTL